MAQPSRVPWLVVTDGPRLILASQSPARRNLLRAAGFDAEAMVSGVDESIVEADRPETLSLVLARMKAEVVATRLRSTERRDENLLVLGCDSVLLHDGAILGKPADAADAIRRWKSMRGGHGVLYTGHCLINLRTGKHSEASAATTVYFADVSDHEIDAYVSTGEPLHVAGAFTIDGLGAPFISSIDGDAGTVIGLSLPLLRDLLREQDIQITDLWRQGAG